MVVHIRQIQAVIMPARAFAEAESGQKRGWSHRCFPGVARVISGCMITEPRADANRQFMYARVTATGITGIWDGIRLFESSLSVERLPLGELMNGVHQKRAYRRRT